MRARPRSTIVMVVSARGACLIGATVRVPFSPLPLSLLSLFLSSLRSLCLSSLLALCLSSLSISLSLCVCVSPATPLDPSHPLYHPTLSPSHPHL